MKYLLSTYLILCMFIVSYSQSTSEPVTIGDIFSELKKINYSEAPKLLYKKCKSFNFKELSPVTGQIDSSDYFEIGSSKDGRIKEVIRHVKRFDLHYKFLLYITKKFDVLILKKLEDEKYYFTSLAFIVIRQPNDSKVYMLDVVPRFGSKKPALAFFYEGFPLTTIEDVCAITQLNNDLFPEREFKVLNTKTLMISDFYYKKENPRAIEAELISFFFTAENYPMLRISNKTDLEQFMQEEQIAEYELEIRPDMGELTEEPLWILERYYRYVK